MIVSNNRHVVRLEKVDAEALVVDDPYGERDVKDTGDNGGQRSRTFASPADPKVTKTVTLTPIWRLGGTYFASYVDGNGADEHTAATLEGSARRPPLGPSTPRRTATSPRTARRRTPPAPTATAPSRTTPTAPTPSGRRTR